MLAKTALTIVLLTFAIPNVGMSGVMMRSFESKTSVSASTGDETPLRKEQDRCAYSTSMKGNVANSLAMTPINSQAVGVEPELFFNAKPPLISSYGFAKWQFVPNSPVFKIPKVPIV